MGIATILAHADAFAYYCFSPYFSMMRIYKCKSLYGLLLIVPSPMLENIANIHN